MDRIGAGDVSPRECEHCRVAFVPRRSSAGRFCSRACAGAYRTARKERPPCEWCGTPIERPVVRTRGQARFFCGRACLRDHRAWARTRLMDV